jgi:hypothetical protein
LSSSISNLLTLLISFIRLPVLFLTEDSDV